MLELDQIYNMDCLDGLKQIPNNFIDLVVTDMPYDNFNFDWVIECKRVLKNDGSIYIQTDCRSVAELKLFMDKYFIFRNWIVWCYKGIPRKTNTYQKVHDDILFYTISDNYTWNQQFQPPSNSTIKRWDKYADKNGVVPREKLTPSMRNKNKTMIIRNTPCRDWWNDISVINIKDTGNKKKLHPFQKPKQLIDRIIKTSSNENDIILDCFIGSGTTIISCLDLNRHFIGFEINKKYYDISLQRLMNMPEKLENFIEG